VAAHGIWLKGENDWAYNKTPNRFAIIQKRKKIINLLNAAQTQWENLLPQFQAGQLIKLRRELQRYHLMQRGLPPLPKTMLDARWSRLNPNLRWDRLLNNGSPLSGRVKKFLIAVQKNPQ